MIDELVRFTAVRAEWNAQIELRAGVKMHDVPVLRCVSDVSEARSEAACGFPSARVRPVG